MEAWKCQCGYKNLGSGPCAKCNSPFHECHHHWDGCKCIKCSTYRDQEHDWDGCVCKTCDKERHEWDVCVCKICGATRHDWIPADKFKKGIKCNRCGLVEVKDKSSEAAAEEEV